MLISTDSLLGEIANSRSLGVRDIPLRVLPPPGPPKKKHLEGLDHVLSARTSPIRYYFSLPDKQAHLHLISLLPPTDLRILRHPTRTFGVYDFRVYRIASDNSNSSTHISTVACPLTFSICHGNCIRAGSAPRKLVSVAVNQAQLQLGARRFS